LLDRGMSKEALAAFEATLAKEPNRLAALVGAAKAALKLDDTEAVRRYYAKVVAIAAEGDTSRTDVTEARAFMAAN
jgi:hypothetical protein